MLLKDQSGWERLINRTWINFLLWKDPNWKNKANKTKHPVDIKMYKKQRNYVVGLNKPAKFKYFDNLDCKKDTKPFWDKCKP